VLEGEFLDVAHVIYTVEAAGGTKYQGIQVCC
jgi:hypothetical protein